MAGREIISNNTRRLFTQVCVQQGLGRNKRDQDEEKQSRPSMVSLRQELINMSILEELEKNRGTTSSALGKSLANQVINGDNEILSEAIQLVKYDLKNEKTKNIRAGAAKILEKVAEKKPELISPYLTDILPALNAVEPQTRWMIIMVFGYCSALNPNTAKKGISYAKCFIREKQGVCLSGAAELFLGFIGSVSTELADEVFPVLLDAYDDPLPNEMDWILEAFMKIVDKVSTDNQKTIIECATEQMEAFKPSTKKRAEKIIKMRNQ